MLILNFIQQNPIIRILGFYLIGIFVSSFISVSLFYLSTILGSVLIAFLTSGLILKSRKSYNLRWIPGTLGFAFWCLLGILLSQNKLYPDVNYSDDTDERNYYGNINSIPSSFSKGFKFDFCVQQISDKKGFAVDEEMILVYLKTEDTICKYMYGDVLVLNTTCSLVKNKGNPKEFDYQSYLNRKGIFRTCFISNADIIECNKISGKRIFSLAYSLRNKLLKVYKDYNLGDKEMAVVSALTLGYKDELEEDSKTSFRESGAMHIMAVSGLHVGIIQMILNFLLSFLLKLRKGKLIRMIIVILLLWFYALMTGLSPSVFRAALMFSFIQIGVSLKREIGIYNIIGTSALIVLLINPLQVYDVGFQFSYLAVIGIIFFYPGIYSTIKIKWWFPDKVWSLLCASFSAQLSLAPLSIYYFNQFPNYFLLTNLFVIPLAFVIVILAIGILLFSFIPVIANLFSIALNYSGRLMIFITETISDMPYSVSHDLYINSYSLFVVYGLLITLSAYVSFKKTIILAQFYAVLIVGLIFSIYLVKDENTSNKLCVFNIDGSSVIFCKAINSSVLIADSLFLNDEKKYSFYLDKYIMSEKAENHTSVGIEEGLVNKDYGLMVKRDFVLIKDDFRMYIPSGKSKINGLKNKLDVDVILLTNNIKSKIDDILILVNCRLVLADASSYEAKIIEWKDECEELGIEFYSTKEQGAFELELD